MTSPFVREATVWKAFAEWLQEAALLRAEFREIGQPLPPALERAVHEGPAPWKPSAPEQTGAAPKEQDPT